MLLTNRNKGSTLQVVCPEQCLPVGTNHILVGAFFLAKNMSKKINKGFAAFLAKKQGKAPIDKTESKFPDSKFPPKAKVVAKPAKKGKKKLVKKAPSATNKNTKTYNFAKAEKKLGFVQR